MPVSPLCNVKDGLGPFVPTFNGVNVGPGDTISVQLTSISGVTAWFLQVLGTDELSTNPALVGVNPTTHEVTTPGTTVTFPFPSGLGRSVLIQSTVTGAGGPVSTTFSLYSLTAGSKRVGSAGEQREGNTSFGWITIVNPIIRQGAAVLFYNDALVPLPSTGSNTIQGALDYLKTNGIFTAAGDLSGSASSQTVLKINGTTVPVTGVPDIGKVLTVFASGVATWQTSSGFTAGGDLSGTPTSQTVIKVNGTTVPVTLIGDVGKALFVTAAGVASWQTALAGITVKDEGSTVVGGPHATLNFVGPGVAATNAGGGQANITVTGTVIVQDEGSPIAGAPHTTLNFTGASVVAADAGGGVASITVTGVTALPEVEASLAAGVFSTINAAFTRAGSRLIDVLYWPATIGALTRSIYFKADIECSTPGTTANVRLQNITDNETVTGTALNTGLQVNTEVASVALTVGVAAGNLKSGTPKQYEVQVSLTGGGAGDTVTITNARLCVRYT